MTREQALAGALQMLLTSESLLASRPGAGSVIAMNEARDAARSALALPPDGVNADMLAALRAIARRLNDCAVTGKTPTFGDLNAIVSETRAAIAKATAQPPAVAAANPRGETLVTPTEIKYLRYLASPERPQSCQRPNHQSLKRMLNAGYIWIIAQSKVTRGYNGADFGITELGRLAIQPRPHIRQYVRSFNKK